MKTKVVGTEWVANGYQNEDKKGANGLQMVTKWNQKGDRKQPTGAKGDTKQAKEPLKACLGELDRKNIEKGSQKRLWPRPIFIPKRIKI